MHPPFCDLGRKKIPQNLLPACLAFRSYFVQLLLSYVLLGLMTDITGSGEAWRNPGSLGSDMRAIANLKMSLISGFDEGDPGKKVARKMSQGIVYSEADPTPLTSTTGHAGTETPAQGNPATGNPAKGNPATGNPATGNPATGNPATGNPATGNPATGNSVTGNPATGNPALP